MPRPVNLSLELLRTFLTLVRTEGDAVIAAGQLGINQPSMSKRLSYLQHAGPVLDHPWLMRVGKTWHLTEEGARILPAVEEIVRRYEQLTHFIDEPSTEGPQVTFACGQQAVTGFVQQALRLFRRKYPDARLRISTLRGRARIEGVANGSLELATVTFDEAAILETARRPLHVQELSTDRLALVCADDALWAHAVRRLPKTKVSPEAFLPFSLILPEPDAGTRKELDKVFRQRGLLGALDIALEIGGWSAILSYVRLGAGVGVVSEAALDASKDLVVRYLDPAEFSPIVTRAICRRVPGSAEELDLTAEAQAFLDALVTVTQSRRG